MMRAALLALTCLPLLAESFPASDVRIVGDLDYGQTSPLVEYTAQPRFRAFVFSAKAGDRIEVNVQGADRKAFVAIADGTLKQLASGTSRLSFRIPNHGPDAEAYYIVFRDSEDKPAKFTVELKRLSGA